MTILKKLTRLGQSIWYDNIRRALLDSGEMQALLDAGVVGVTSNPSIFEKAIAGSQDYDSAIELLAAQGKSTGEIYETLALEDIGRAADLFRSVYERTKGLDGYVSLEVSPTLADDTEGTVAEARRLFAALNRPNVMIKVPATPAGIPAITTLIGEGINVNVTLIFALSHYEDVTDAYITGLEKLAAAGGDLSRVASVASFFISRVDSAVDKELADLGNTSLLGKIAVANARVAYGRFQQIFSGKRWQKLAKQGARVQRPLWASTSTKNPAYSDTLYLDMLVGPDTVNTVPPDTLVAYLDRGKAADELSENVQEARGQLEKLAALGIDLAAVTQKLQDDGVAAFAKSFDSLLESVAQKAELLTAKRRPLRARLGAYQDQVEAALRQMDSNDVINRIWARDHTVWRPTPVEISNRLGWLDIAERMTPEIGRLNAVAKSVRAEGFTHVLLLGMGGSSLAPEVLYRTFGQPAGDDNPYLELAVLDSTDPGRVLEFAQNWDLRKTIFVVATKSGGTVETFSFFKYFYNKTAELVGEAVGRQFIAITDPGSGLADVAKQYDFRETFLNDPDIGGRYSALSLFGLVPAALIGVDLSLLLARAQMSAQFTRAGVSDNDSARLGAIMGVLAGAGRDKLTLVASDSIASFGDWVEQLVAESTGKEGKGILPVVGEPVGEPELYGGDRLFVYLRLDGEDEQSEGLDALAEAGHPVVKLTLRDRYDMGGQFFLWEMATAVASVVLDIQPFDQPNVESAKVLARKMVAEYMETGHLPQSEPAPLTAAALDAFLSPMRPGDYIAIHAYVPPTAGTDAALQDLRLQLRARYKAATTIGYGPRFLHSTGQLHKGDGGRGYFIQLTADPEVDALIPDEAGRPDSAMSFGVLEMSQALGDGQALIDNQRRVIRFHLNSDVEASLKQLMTA